MKTARHSVTKTFHLLAVLISLFGCNTAQDRSEVRALAERIHKQIRASDYQTVYENAGATFQKVGPEAEFVKTMQALREQYGYLKKITKLAYEKRVESSEGESHLLIFDLEFDNTHAREEMGFTRSPTGKMELSELSFEPPK